MKLLFALSALASATASVTYDFSGKVCYITGGTSGLGLAAAEAAAQAGCKTVFTGRREEKGKAIEERIRKDGHEITYMMSDVTDSASVKKTIDDTIAKYGALHYAFNNAGGAAASDWAGKPHLITDEDFEFTMKLNVQGVFYSLKHQVAAILEHNIEGASLVNCASIYGSRATAMATAYGTSKHALHGMTKSFAMAYAKTLRVNDLSPAFSPSELTAPFKMAEQLGAKTVTTWHPNGRWLENQEVVDGLFFLWSEQSSFYNGQDLILDGGLVNQYVPPDTFSADVANAFKALGEAAAKADKEDL